MNKKFILFFIICLAIYVSACKKQVETPVENVKTGGSTVPDPSVVDTAKLITGWWQPENYLVQNKLYFGADKFFYIDSLNQKAPYAGTWSLENNIIRCKSTIGGRITKFEIASVNTGKLYLKTIGVGVLEPFNKTADPAFTSPPLIPIVGTGVQGFNGNDILATQATINGADDIVMDKAGNIYFGDYKMIRKISATDGKVTLYAGNNQWGSGQQVVNVPATSTAVSGVTLAIDKNDDIYFPGLTNIYKISAITGIITLVAGGTRYHEDGHEASRTQIGPLQPGCLAISGNGDLFFVENNSNSIRKISSATGIVTTIAVSDRPPISLAVDNTGAVYFTDKFLVRKIAKNSKVITTIAGKLYEPKDYKAGNGGLAKNAMFKLAIGVAVSAKGDVFISDYDANEVRRINVATGIITRIAGNDFSGRTVYGIHSTAYSLYGPRVLITDNPGDNVYITDLSYCVHKVAVF
jgi:hypothetical protein